MNDQRDFGDETIDVPTHGDPTAQIRASSTPERQTHWGPASSRQSAVEGSAGQYSSDPRERAFQLSQSETKIISGQDFLLTLERAGIIAIGDRVRRVVIDADVKGAVLMYVERFGDTRLLSIETTLKGAQIQTFNVAEIESSE